MRDSTLASNNNDKGECFLGSPQQTIENIIWTFEPGNGPIIATAIHDGHALRPEVAELIKLSDSDRFREEDPYTGSWVNVADTRIVALRSRFEVDLNRPRAEAVYIEPEDCWGLDVWHKQPSDEIVTRSLAEYDAYYSLLNTHLTETRSRFGKFAVLDIHSYNHRRDGPDAPPEPADENPEVNIGTGSLDRDRWGRLVDRFIDDMGSFDLNGRRLDVRENVKFKGGNHVKWIHESFGESGCGLAIEFKKFWMDEWTGQPDNEMIEAIRAALSSTIPGLREELLRI
ncbi:N-formylglutamate amidohydrolase [soil metagenome]